MDSKKGYSANCRQMGTFYNDDKNAPAVFAGYTLYLTW